MAEYGLDKDRFPNLSGDMFDCPICTNVVVNPKECTGCGDLFCSRCIDDWMKKTRYLCQNTDHVLSDAPQAFSQ